MPKTKLPPEVRTKPFASVYISQGNGRIKTLLMNGFNAFGGIEKIVKPGQTVLIKPNLVGAHAAITGGNTDVRMAEAVIELIKQYCNPGKITVGEETDTGGVTQRAFDECGWTAMCKRQGVDLIDFEKHEMVEVKVDNAMYAEEFLVPKLFLEADVYITMAMLKNHDTVCVTGAIKNSFGCVTDVTRRQAHRDNAVEQYLTDIARVRTADFSIIDGRIGMEGIAGGAFFEHPRYANRIIMGDNAVSVDAVCAHVMEQNPRIRYLQWCEEYGLGTCNLDYINIFGMPLEEAKVHFMTPADEIAEFTDGKLNLIDLGSCSQCRAVAQGTLHRFRNPESVIGNVDIVYGPGNWDIPENRAEKCLLIGDCVQERYRGLGKWIPGCPMNRDVYLKALAELDIVCTKCAKSVEEFVKLHTPEELQYVRILASGKTVFVGQKNNAGDLDSIIAAGQCENGYARHQIERVRRALSKLGLEDQIDPEDIVGSVVWHGSSHFQLQRQLDRINEARPRIDALIAEAKAKLGQ